jgi:hypothetical protein
MLSAIGKAYGDGSRFEIFKKLSKAMGKEYLLTNWNDAPGRTKEDVLAVFKEAGV